MISLTKGDKCDNEVAFYKKAQKIVSNLLNNRRFPATCCGELHLPGRTVSAEKIHLPEKMIRPLPEIQIVLSAV